jgi:hypothetical protein
MKPELACRKTQSPNVIVAASTKPGTVTMPEEKDNTLLMLVIVISALGDSTCPMFITKNKTFDETSLATQKLFEEHDYTVRTAHKTFITEVLFIDWLQNVFIPKVNHLRERAKSDGKVVLILDGHASHVTPRVIAFAGSQKLSLIRLVPYSSHITQPLDLRVFGLCKVIYSKERQSKGMKVETKKMYLALLAFYKATILPMVRSSFKRDGFLVDLDDIRNPVQIDPSRVLARIALPDSEFDGSFIDPAEMRKDAEGMNAARKTRTNSETQRL